MSGHYPPNVNAGQPYGDQSQSSYANPFVDSSSQQMPSAYGASLGGDLAAPGPHRYQLSDGGHNPLQNPSSYSLADTETKYGPDDDDDEHLPLTSPHYTQGFYRPEGQE